jgi:hypothetical protein
MKSSQCLHTEWFIYINLLILIRVFFIGPRRDFMTNLSIKGRRMCGFWVMIFAILFVLLGSAQIFAQDINPEIFSRLRYRHIGPPGNRTSAVVGVPGDSMVYYIGASSGGIWKSSDGGNRWDPVFDDQPAQSIGSLAIAPSDPNVVWAGTGEPFIRSNISIGNGIYKSTDAGKS